MRAQQLSHIFIEEYQTTTGATLDCVALSYEIFGQPLHTAPIVMVNHALTGNSTVCGEQGWWKALIGKDKCIDTTYYTIIAFNIPGNGYDGIPSHLIADYTAFTARDIVILFAKGLKQLQVKSLYAVIGGSVGGGIAWELAVLKPKMIQHLIPIASDWKATDWLKGCCLVQNHILQNSSNPVHDARLHAMLLYRTPESFTYKFDRGFNEEQQLFNVESWLLHHGKKLDERFCLAAYKTMNHILSQLDITQNQLTFEEAITKVTAQIHIISVDTDMFFTAEEDKKTHEKLQQLHKKSKHSIIKSIHGHDAFLIEYEQLEQLLKDTFKREVTIARELENKTYHHE
ncbi:alpha/beta fold hydrolase [Aquimarina rhabdastrellae]